jgi:glyoxylase-like metal-dependent hydrolase (beta-lactamase superfamily II)
MLTFPNAEVVVQRREWNDAVSNNAVMTRTYFRDHLLPLAAVSLRGERSRLRLVDSPIPFPADYHPGRDEPPRTPWYNRRTEIAPGLWVLLTPGHTWGQQAVMFEDDRGRTVVFTPDVLPTRWHVGQAYSLSYDVEPYTSMVTKRWLLEAAAAEGWRLLLDHEPGEPLFRVQRNGKGWFELVEEPLNSDG